MQLQYLEWPRGELTALWSDRGLCSLSFGRQELAGASPLPASQLRLAGPWALSSALREYFAEGGPLEFSLEHLDWTAIPAFHQLVLKRCAAIPRGEFMTYGQLADAVGSRQAARAVGQAMARNRWPLVIPCHRVVGHSGKLTGYSGQGGVETKQWLLQLEGVTSEMLKHNALSV